MNLLFPFLFSLLSLIFGNDEAELVFAGDAMMHQGQLDAARNGDQYDYSGYFTDIIPYVTSADYAVVNLETAVSRPPYSGYPCFNAPESYVTELKNAGFDMMLTANNHTLDRGDRGLRSTIEVLDRMGIDHLGTYVDSSSRSDVLPYIKEINGIKVGFLNYTYGTNGIKPGPDVVVDYIDREKIRKDVEESRSAGAEVLIVCIHWGDEYRLLPNETQRSLARFLRELDVDVIVGGHPHVIQPVEFTMRSDGRPQLLIYSLGNFISNMKKTDCRGGMIARVTLRRDSDGRVIISDASYRLVYTEPADGSHNFRLRWVDKTPLPEAVTFKNNARRIFNEHNINVTEELVH